MEAFDGEAWSKQARCTPTLFAPFALFGLQHVILLLADWVGHQSLLERLWGAR
jgi:hypothetical protein